ncbi:MAG: ABC transporter permease [Caulobacter sp.]|nr:ABC transporter permease [Vitreoscilla sp.]
MSAVIVDAHRKPRSAASEALVALWRAPHIRACMIVLLLYLLVAVLGYAHLLPDHEASVGDAQEPPSLHLARLLGTDILGRSVLWRVLAGAQTAVTIGLITTALAVPFGTALGLAAGYFGGWVDAVINWVYSVVVSVPDILLITAISYAMGKGLASMCVAIAATSWVSIMRLVRGEVLRHKGSDYVLAARSLGARPSRIMFSEILPNVIHVAIITTSLVLLAAVKGEVILTYLGLGVQEGASWGLLIAGASQDLTNDVWGPLVGTVVAMFLLIYALSAIGDALRDVLDPRVQ